MRSSSTRTRTSASPSASTTGSSCRCVRTSTRCRSPQLAAETKRVVEQARKGRLENIGKGHFTISNLGMFGVEEFSAIINPPESGILAVSAAREAVIVENGAMRAGRSMTMTLSADHRIVDGVMAAKFMQRLKQILEHPGEELA